jgi:hypothetical protein
MFGVGVEGAGAACRGMIVRATQERFKSRHMIHYFSHLDRRSSQFFIRPGVCTGNPFDGHVAKWVV